ncbi:MAG: Kelch repeat-containing protein [Actinomycetota bacterium]
MRRQRCAAIMLLLLLSACVSSPRYPSGNAKTSTSLFDLFTPGAPRWRTLPDAPIARQNAAYAQLGDRIYLIGGITTAGISDRADAFDVVTHVWSKVPSFPIQIDHASGAVFDSSIWVIGGSNAQGQSLSSTYRLIRGQWVPGPPLHEARFAAATAVIGDSLYVFGGASARAKLVSQTEVLKLGTSSWKPGIPIPTPRSGLAASVIGSIAYVSGGRDATGNLATFESFDASRDSWSKLIDLPHARSDHASVIFRGKVVLLGGEPDPALEPAIAPTDEFDPARSVWIQSITAMFRAKHGFAASESGGKVYVLGGATLSGVKPTVTCEELISS